MGSAKSKEAEGEPNHLHEPLTKKEKDAIDKRVDQKTKNKPRELRPKKKDEYRIKKKKKQQKRNRRTYTYEQYEKPENEPWKISKAKSTAPKQDLNSVVFFWDHETDSFRFSQKLRKLRNERPLKKTPLLKHL